MNIFEYDSYREYLIEKIRSLPKRGRGQNLKIAEFLGIHTTMVTHLLNGKVEMSVDQALGVCEYFHLGQLECDYFLALVQRARAGNKRTRRYFDEQIKSLKARQLKLTERLELKTTLDERDQAMFYSSWYYSGIWLFCAAHRPKSIEEISERLSLPIQTVNQVMKFLLQTGFVKETSDGFDYGSTSTYVGPDSPLLTRHLTNWRMKVLESVESRTDDDLFYSNPITLSKKDFFKVREEIVKLVENFRKISEPSEPELLCCLNVDWIKI